MGNPLTYLHLHCLNLFVSTHSENVQTFLKALEFYFALSHLALNETQYDNVGTTCQDCPI